MSEVVLALYRPHEGQADALARLVERHLPLLREKGLVTDRPSLLLRASDGTLLEIFEWRAGAPQKAHVDPGVDALWDEMGKIADFPSLRDLPEAGTRFPHFVPVA